MPHIRARLHKGVPCKFSLQGATFDSSKFFEIHAWQGDDDTLIVFQNQHSFHLSCYILSSHKNAMEKLRNFIAYEESKGGRIRNAAMHAMMKTAECRSMFLNSKSVANWPTSGRRRV